MHKSTYRHAWTKTILINLNEETAFNCNFTSVIPLAVYCQNQENEDKPFHFIELGIGAAYARQIHGDINIALSNGIGKYMANFLEMDGSNVCGHGILKSCKAIPKHSLPVANSQQVVASLLFLKNQSAQPGPYHVA